MNSSESVFPLASSEPGRCVQKKKKRKKERKKNLGLTQSILWHVLLLQPTIHHSTTGQLSPTYLCLCDTDSHIYTAAGGQLVLTTSPTPTHHTEPVVR